MIKICKAAQLTLRTLFGFLPPLTPLSLVGWILSLGTATVASGAIRPGATAQPEFFPCQHFFLHGVLKLLGGWAPRTCKWLQSVSPIDEQNSCQPIYIYINIHKHQNILYNIISYDMILYYIVLIILYHITLPHIISYHAIS